MNTDSAEGIYMLEDSRANSDSLATDVRSSLRTPRNHRKQRVSAVGSWWVYRMQLTTDTHVDPRAANKKSALGRGVPELN